MFVMIGTQSRRKERYRLDWRESLELKVVEFGAMTLSVDFFFSFDRVAWCILGLSSL